jgi:ABC-2 type transport system permease protein
MFALFKREFRSYFQTMIGYLFIALVLAFVGVFLWVTNLAGGYASFEYTLSSVTILFLLLIPILTMRTLTEERGKRTDQLLYALPLTSFQILFGKFLALCAVFSIPCGVMLTYPLLLSAFGEVNYAAAYTGILGFFLLGCALLALALFVSSFTENQIVSAALIFAVIFLLYLMDSLASIVPATASTSLWCFLLLIPVLSVVVYLLCRSYLVTGGIALAGELAVIITYVVKPAVFEGAMSALMRWLSVFERFSPFTNGLFDIGNLVYLVTFTAFFLFLSTQSFEKRRWS